MHKLLTTLCIVGFLVSGCASSTPMPATATPTSVPTPTSTPEPECSAGTTPDFADYASWTKVNPKPIKGHETFVNIYVNDAAKDIYLSASGETFPTCAMIVKPHLVSEDSETISAVTVMVKMPTGYDPEHNDWWWGMYDKDGKVAKMSGKVDVCIACHQTLAKADYVFSHKVMEESNQ
jgi:hypothetical protein